MTISRRAATGLLAGAAFAPNLAFAQAKPVIRRPIPHSTNGETLPAVGVGTAIVFDNDDITIPTAVVKALLDNGGTIIDTARSYGKSEAAVGGAVAALNARNRVFLSTKLQRYARGPGEVDVEAKESHTALRAEKIDLLMLHNVRDPNQSLAALTAMKQKGIIRYTGMTTTSEGAYDAFEQILKREKPDFIEVDYAIDNREVEARILPAARDAGSAVLVALPFGRGRVFRTVLSKPVPDYAKEIECTTWAQFFLKFIISHPVITAAIPGTSRVEHMVDNMGGARGVLPDEAMRKRMIATIEAV